MSHIRDFFQFFRRMKHPISLPEDIGQDLGVQVLYNQASFEECIDYLTTPSYCPKKLSKFMPRKEAEAQFKKAIRKEKFKHSSLFSYHIFHGWLAFELVFDEDERLRRLYLQHKALPCTSDEGVEISLHS